MKQRNSTLPILVTTGFTVLALVGIGAGQEAPPATSQTRVVSRPNFSLTRAVTSRRALSLLQVPCPVDTEVRHVWVV